MTIKDRDRLDDHYSRKARKEGYPARSVWKLEELNQKYGLFKRGQKVLDLGCAPGSWSLYAAKAVGSEGLVLGLDLNPPDNHGFPPWVKFEKADIILFSPEFAENSGPFDAVLSDAAPNTTGHREVDQARSLELANCAWQWAQRLLIKKGFFLFKVFEGPELEDLIKNISPSFERLKRLKPKAVRTQSLEIYIIGLGYKCPFTNVNV
ncbi:MAG: RlmE family RNA methyltransferase [Deltaproteobacteria bacterium]|nr:RlmE family RNA methyltransferase [Deltaproteobacteria bacterium]